MHLTEIVERLAQHRAKVEFLDERGVLTSRRFDELHADVLALSAELKRLGVDTGVRVGILGPTSYAWMVWDLAVLHCGAVSVALPHEGLDRPYGELAEQLQIGLLAAASQLVPADVASLPETVDFDDFDALPLRTARLANRQFADDARAHSLVFSSGTTGKTKGLVISRPGTEHLLNLYEGAFGVVPDDRFLTFLPFANYQQRMAYYFGLYHGTDIAYVPFQGLFPGLKRLQPTYVIAPPVFFDAAMSLVEAGLAQSHEAPTLNREAPAQNREAPTQQGEAPAQNREAPTQQGEAPAQNREASARAEQRKARLKAILGGRVRYLITGMAPTRRQTLDYFWLNDVPLYEAFGITEAGMVCWNKPGQVKIGSVGQPAEPGSLRLSDEGEVIIEREHLLSLGYFDSSEADARATFLNAGSVATGDIAVVGDDGFVTLVGRKKDAIVTRSGEKFHPEAIEVRIQEDARVRSAVVLGSEPLSAILVVRDPSDNAATAALRAQVTALNATLPVYQRVRQVLFTDQDFTPENGLRTRNLKLNRRAIQERFQDQLLPAAGDACVA